MESVSKVALRVALHISSTTQIIPPQIPQLQQLEDKQCNG